jgi:hypothetical protein
MEERKIKGYFSHRLFVVVICTAFLITVFPPVAVGQETDDLDIFWDEFSDLPTGREERCNKIVALFARLGAREIFIEPVAGDGAPLRGGCPGNVIVPLDGAGEGTLIISAHLDAIGEGVGALDDFSGVMMMAALFRSLSNLSLNHPVLFVAFDREEEGLLGSRSFLEESGHLPEDIFAMINLECLGITLPHPWPEGSSDALEDIFCDVGMELGHDISPVSMHCVSADSVSFLNHGVAAITIDGITEEHFYILDSEYDEPGVIRREVFSVSYSILLPYILKLDALTDPINPQNRR